jgi:hypothetical protein
MQAGLPCECKSGGLEYLFTPFLKQANAAIRPPALPFKLSSSSSSVVVVQSWGEREKLASS